jgi:hypothetical protein
MTKREREYHKEKKVWKAFVEMQSEPDGPHYFYEPSLSPSLDWEPQPVFGLQPNRPYSMLQDLSYIADWDSAIKTLVDGAIQQ